MIARITVLLCALGALSTLGCAPRWPNQRLGRAEVASCIAQGGYESRTAFGYPICQKRYADAGQVCANDADCLGGCLDERPEAADLKIGVAATGRCETESYTPGCYAIIDDGKVKNVLCID